LEELCRLVLYELNPLAAAGASRALSVLFPMESVFEAYVAGLLRARLPDWKVRTQVRGAHLGTVGANSAFPLRPDLVLQGAELIVADTKWKRLDFNAPPTYGVSNADAYQMLAYARVFQDRQADREVWLLYPSSKPVPLPSVQLGDVTLRLVLVDLTSSTFINAPHLTTQEDQAQRT